ncbi:fimbria/pilus outer membrane usher protein [Pseudomonas syringae]|uniref:Fimbria/pilus outer membrane usher protein n=1 Tax=Pseudomonas syringae TaxID=317 RepID=A0A9Q3ZX64_PSESX|nr:fimbria/pilus outer membrane usher protein [Pseudomonas syringae]MCF5061899.1 fimbria/pilus outer membrane usher protein [Pseudomonas syringae]MCF5072480.1 fimbria/pilus outer membrane usher protein [Pseudomonas syringae]MCF5117626.1 fimbria/pilus outer membrane usher protein [Pseudomonas syringae]MCF5377825.1 fimbria/pilus outer membrane usher protein [Pseudomonas syringae]
MPRSSPFTRRRAVKAFGCPLAAVVALHLAPAHAGYEFDASFLEIGGGQSSAAVKQQVSAMSEGQLPGIYRVDVQVNQHSVEQRDVRFVRATGTADRSATGLFPCLDGEFFRAQGVADTALQNRHDADTTCIAFDQGLAGVVYDYDFNRQLLSIEIPQAYLGSVAFEVRRRQWSDGENVAFTNYSFSASTADSDSGRRQNQFGSLRSGINAGAWRLRNFSTWQKGTGDTGRWESMETYAQRDMGNMMAIATLGDATTEGDLFDAIPYRGLGIASDLDMLPDQSREFAPVVRGIANGRSRVIIRQRGYVIHEQWVPSGPFALTDLYPTASNGDIEVTVEGPDGQRQVYTQSFSSVPYMLREGQQSYSLFAGQYRPAQSAFVQQTPTFLQASLRRGLSGSTTLFGASLLSEQYNAGLLGFAHDFAGFGAVSVDVTHARSDAMGHDKTSASGQSFRFRYSKSLAATDTHFSLIGYRYSTGDYYSFNEALNSRNAGQTLDTYRSGHMKSNFTANVSQQLGGYGGVYANVSKTAYWDKGKADTSVQLGYSVSSGSISYSLGLGLNKGADSDDRSVSLSVSMPLGGTRNQRVTANMNQSGRGAASRTATLSGNAFADDTLAYSAGVSQQVNGPQREAGGTFAAQYDAPGAIVRGAYNASSGNRQLDLGMEGSVVAYGSNLMFSQPLGETNVIVATPGAADVAVSNKRGVRTNANGYTVVPSALPYRKNRVSLDTQSMPADVDIAEPVQEVTPNRGAFVLADFDTRRGKRILFRISDTHGEAAPFAARAELFAADGRSLGNTLVADKGRAFLTGVPPEARLVISVDGQAWCSRELKLQDDGPAEGGITQLNIHCERAAGGSGAKDS